MITIISDKNEIRNLHKQFHTKLDEILKTKIDCWVGFPGGNFQDVVRYSETLNIWISNHKQDTKYWNGFGIGKPIEGTNNSLVGEINFPNEEINRRIAGAFGVEDNGNVLVLHRGKIGGGKPGVGKSLFTDNFRGDKIIAIDGERENEFCLVGELSSKHLPKQVANFIKEIKRIKDKDKNGETVEFDDIDKFNFLEEHSGQSKIDRQGSSTINRTHGIIVNSLVKQLELLGHKVGNDRNKDLFIYKNNKIKTLFEIKTSSETQNLYSAVGQLLVYSIAIKNPVKLIAVFPDKLNKIVERKLLEYGIHILYFKWVESNIEFMKLNEIITE